MLLFFACENREDPFDCGALIGCGGDGWLISNSNLYVYVINATCSDTFATPFTSLTALNCQCPEVSIAPCTCEPTATTDGSAPTMLTVSCANQKLDDPTIADVIVRVAPTTPLDTLNLRNNSITFVPKGLAQYTRLVDLVVSFNAITKINLDDLNLPAPVVNLDLSFNTITAIANSSLPGIKNKAEFIRGI